MQIKFLWLRSSDGCLGELTSHWDKCEANPDNTEVKCFCKQQLEEEHKKCLDDLKNELYHLNESHSSK